MGASVAQWIEQRPAKSKVAGSSPAGRTHQISHVVARALAVWAARAVWAISLRRSGVRALVRACPPISFPIGGSRSISSWVITPVDRSTISLARWEKSPGRRGVCHGPVPGGVVCVIAKYIPANPFESLEWGV